VVRRLVEAGLVSRTPSTDDRRRTRLALTAAGRARLRRRSSGEQRMTEAVARLGVRRAAALSEELAVLVGALREPQEPG
jgi:DNA-binding MarR family transcriptional regulator